MAPVRSAAPATRTATPASTTGTTGQPRSSATFIVAIRILIATMNVADDLGWPVVPVVLAGVAVLVAGAALLTGAIGKARGDALAELADEGVEG